MCTLYTKTGANPPYVISYPAMLMWHDVSYICVRWHHVSYRKLGGLFIQFVQVFLRRMKT
jgi:hypothetical protein